MQSSSLGCVVFKNIQPSLKYKWCHLFIYFFALSAKVRSELIKSGTNRESCRVQWANHHWNTVHWGEEQINACVRAGVVAFQPIQSKYLVIGYLPPVFTFTHLSPLECKIQVALASNTLFISFLGPTFSSQVLQEWHFEQRPRKVIGNLIPLTGLQITFTYIDNRPRH